MAETFYGVNDAATVKLWRRKLAREALKATTFKKFIGESSSSMVQVIGDTSKSAGDRVRMFLRVAMSGDGVQGDETLQGKEESLTTYNDEFIISQLRHAHKSAGKMSEQRVPWGMREEAYAALKDWWAERYDTMFFNTLCGNTAVTDLRYTGFNAPVAPAASRVLRAGGLATDQALQADSTKIFTLDLIDKAVEKAKTATPLIRPVSVNGEPHYVMFLHPYHVTSLRTNTANGQWQDIQKAAMASGATDNPIFTGALGKYNNVVLHESVRVTTGVHSTTSAVQSSVRRAVLCGAQAAGIGFGQGHSLEEFNWKEELFDYGNQLGIAGSCILGMKKAVYNSVDFATIVVPTYAAAAA